MTISEAIVTSSTRYRQRAHPSISLAQRGFALVVGLVCLLMLSLIAMVMMRATLLETRMATAYARRVQAFEMSDALRHVPEPLIAQHVYARGWPQSWGGDIADSQFYSELANSYPTAWPNMLAPNKGNGTGLQMACGVLIVLYEATPCNGADLNGADAYDTSKWVTAFVLDVCLSPTSNCAQSEKARTRISIVRDGTMTLPGQGAAQAQGYVGAGASVADGGSTELFELRSVTHTPGGGDAQTIAQYKVDIPD